MALNHQTSNPLFKALSKQYESEVASAYATLTVYFDSPVAIGEHPQHLEEMDKLVNVIAEAEDKLKALNTHFNNTQI
jgi:methylaspartate ammonia-lyase|tara:strand:- start:328 stop:558 length:231 start_codon:yes stop_codon:yes gene_type:complete